MKKRTLFVLTMAVLLIFGVSSGVKADTLGLSLVMDGSGSINSAEWNLQLQGYADTITDPTVVPQDSTVALNAIQFSTGVTEEVPFTLIDSAATASSFANDILAISQMNGATCISCGIYEGKDTLLTNGFGDRMVIDVSTDGDWNRGVNPLGAAQDVVDNDGITAVNALGIGVTPTFNYPADSFAMEVDSFADFGDAIKDKIRREVTPVPEPGTILLLGSGLIGLAFARRKVRK